MDEALADEALADDALIERIDAMLPQTQCMRCGYPDCRGYATALASGHTELNRCPPGGQAGIEALAALLQRPPLPLDESCGREGDPGVAWIDAQACIGCARCLPVCPVDAIIGAQRHLHGVLEVQCTGCELCLPSCPVDCIHLRPREAGQSAPDARDNRRRYSQHQTRQQQQAREQAALLEQRKRTAPAGNTGL